jgi:hypothetical protein
MAYDLEELQAPTYDISERGITATRRLRLYDWADVDEYIDDLFPGGVPTGDNPYRPGQSTFPGRSALILRSVKVEPFDANNISGTDSYNRAVCGSGADITLEYGTVDYDEQSNPDSNPDDPTTWMSHDISVQQQYMTHALSGLKWSTGGAAVHEDVLPGFPITMINHDLTWHNVPNPPLSTWYTYVGKCNSSTFLGHAAERVIFSGFNAGRQAKTDGSVSYECRLTFQARICQGGTNADAAGWNHFLDPSTGAWDRIVTKTGSNKIIPEADLNDIFKYS